MEAREFCLALMASLILAGCLQPNPASTSSAETTSTRPVVVALIDTGTNPYEPSYRIDSEIPYEEWGIPVMHRLSLTRGPDGNRADGADEELWKDVQPGVLYAFEGTRLLAISLEFDDEDHIRDDGSHGAGTNYLLARDAPDAILVMVQVHAVTCRTRVECMTDPSMAQAMSWVSEQPWIDVVSVSLGIPGNAPDRPELHGEMGAFLEASERSAASGKLVIFGGGNTPSPTLQSHFVGPPWVVAVGGFEPHANGQHVLSPWTTLDVVANYSEYTMAYDELSWATGTSLATPIVAATLAEAWRQVRAADPSRENVSRDLRAALNASAVMPDPTAWNPTPPGYEPLPNDLLHALTLPVATQAQVGWGYVNASLAPEIARRVLEQDFSIPAGKEQAALYQPQYQRAREEYWAAYVG